MAPHNQLESEALETWITQILASLGSIITENIDNLIFALWLLVLFNLAFIFVYFFSVTDSKAKAVEESKS